MAKDYFKGLGSASKKITKAQNKYADFAGEVAKLPYQLTDEYRKAQDPALSSAINKSEQNMFSAPINALETYKDISDPTLRRSLAEKAAGTATTDYKNLTDERTRREGVYSDYVAKWTGLYGAEAAKEQAKVNSQVDSWNRDMNLAGQKQTQANRIEDNAESRRRWDYEQAHKGGSGSGTADKRDTQFQSFTQSISDKVRNGDMDREEAKAQLKTYFPDYDENVIYDILPDNFTKKGMTESQKLDLEKKKAQTISAQLKAKNEQSIADIKRK